MDLQEKFVTTNGVSICYETQGDPSHPPLLLIMGLGVQMIGWSQGLIDQMIAAGYYVIRFDNRDVGRSTHFHHAAPPSLSQILRNAYLQHAIPAAYSLSDMAADAVKVLDHLEIESAHVAGVSMGGMISQCLALEHPKRVRSLTSIMSTTSERDLPRPEPKATRVLLKKAPSYLNAYLEHSYEGYSVLSGSRHPVSREDIYKVARAGYMRGRDPKGVGRQIAAIANTPGRRQALQQLRMPAVVVHGDEDPLVPFACGIDTAKAIPDCQLVTILGMGHTMPPTVWEQIVAAINMVAQKAAMV
ncbi:MAG: alpha/beta fold hydrolase [Candidatus Promineifilaceae bacterium]